MTADGPIMPPMLEYIKRGVETAERRDAEVLIIQLNTPGGDLDTMLEIIREYPRQQRAGGCLCCAEECDCRERRCVDHHGRSCLCDGAGDRRSARPARSAVRVENLNSDAKSQGKQCIQSRDPSTL